MNDPLDIARHLRAEYGEDAMEIAMILSAHAKDNNAPPNAKCLQAPDNRGLPEINEKWERVKDIIGKGFV